MDLADVMVRRRSRQLLHLFDEVDALVFTDLLRDKFPNLKIVRFEYWDFPEGEGPFAWDHLPGPENLHYMDSLADPRDWRFRCWLEPPDWLPIWLGPNERGIFFLLNQPVHRFVFERAKRQPGVKNLCDGRVWAYWDEPDSEHRRVFEKVMRLVRKVGNNVLVPLDDAGKPLPCEPRRTAYWAGPHAIAWCLADPERRLSSSYRPPDPGDDSG